MATTIDPTQPVTTLINVFTVRPERQAELVALLSKATDEVVAGMPGFVSANIHASTDGVRVVNYAQWTSAEAMGAMLADPVAQPHLAAAAEVAESFEPHTYTVEAVHSR
ncbi:antibiotic biosynthesis monooxygenase family protein [Kutzneria sp. CA-103260]|uniref:antibiotic biosynthesis monooxygenase family protein n=1 Tax=Kutzneria sp. CA-103260 TaxID=2802641 RepID=UPI001BAB607A|nr:antibiotic biosynthesis monooxygenase family protein [Kutzneria sp. CA-103260]QUQ64862.1 tetracenomycin polyketide synthesis hydroxylase TcmH [Kutzneria sp. CA-103260]